MPIVVLAYLVIAVGLIVYKIIVAAMGN